MTQATEKKLPIEGGEVFNIEGRTAFLIMPEASTPEELTPWVWYAPTLEGLPEAAERWMLETFLSSGIAIAGVDVGESFGSPEGRRVYSKFYKSISEERGLAPKACLLARSRGGLMLYNWAAENPQAVACIAGIYPVCNLRSFPGLKRACSAYDMTKEELAAELSGHNPIDRLAPLAAAKVPIFHIHGDSDGLVPLDQNSAVVKERYEQLGGEMELTVFKGHGHTTWSGWFENQKLVDFVIASAKSSLNETMDSDKR